MFICPETGSALIRTKIKGGYIWYSPFGGGHSVTIALLVVAAVGGGLLVSAFGMLGFFGDFNLLGAHGLVGFLMSYVIFRFPKMRFAYVIPVVRHMQSGPGVHTYLRSLQWVRLPIGWIPVFYLAYIAVHVWVKRDLIDPILPLLSFVLGGGLGYLTHRLLR